MRLAYAACIEFRRPVSKCCVYSAVTDERSEEAAAATAAALQ